MTSWQELTIHVHRDAEEAVSNFMIEMGSQGVAISDSADYVGQGTVLVNSIPKWSSQR